jgi:Undecaprenyl-phosphate glucose phosphotransferase
MLKQRHQLFVTLFGITDACSVLGACAVAWIARDIRHADLAMSLASFGRESLAILVVPSAILVMISLRLYRPRRDRALWGEVGEIIRASVITTLLVIAMIWMLGLAPEMRPSTLAGPAPEHARAPQPLRFQIGVLALALPLILSIERVALRAALRAMRRRGINVRHVAIIGVGRLGQITARTLGRNAWTGIRVSYFVSHHPSTERTTCIDKPIMGGLDDLESVLETWPIDAVYLALPNALASDVPEILHRLDRFPVDVRLVPDVRAKYLTHAMSVSELEGMPILSYRESPLAGIGGVLKRALDLVGAAGAIVLLAPLMIVIGIAVRIGSPGPVIFRQRRVSLGGEEFWIYKFRTMRQTEDEQAPTWTDRDDPRVTRIGSFLRRTSLDELPQLFNVLGGSMSLVGPRPERPELIDRFREDWRGYMLRQHVKAGMTGWAQVNGLRGNTSLRKRLQYDLFYIRHWSIGFDIRILLLTLVRGFVNKNAY